MRVIGLMSGTSADAMDVAVVDWPAEGPSVHPFELVAYREFPHSDAYQRAVHALAAAELPAEAMLRELVRIDTEVAEISAAAIDTLLSDAGLPTNSVDAIASHGQTVAHHPEVGGSLQIGCPARIAERTGLPVVADFRRRDLAMGGEGAPLAPFFHHAVFSSQPNRPGSGPEEDRGVLNLGGIANLTWLPRGGDPDAVIAYDVGPANALLDGVISIATQGADRFDADGALAAAGTPDPAWLAELLADPYLERPPPKSTGRERYGLAEAEALFERSQREGLGLSDLLATLAAFTAEAIVRAWQERAGDAGGGRLLVGGGGYRNRTVIQALEAGLPGVRVEAMDALGVPSDAAEAMAFSLLGRNALLGLPNQLPQCTGVPSGRVLGVLHAAPPRSGAR